MSIEITLQRGSLDSSGMAGSAGTPVAAPHSPSIRKNPRTEPRAVRIAIIALAIAFLSVFVVLPLVMVLTQALAKGVGTYLAALTDPEALSAIRLTLLGGCCFRRSQSHLRRDRGL